MDRLICDLPQQLHRSLQPLPGSLSSHGSPSNRALAIALCPPFYNFNSVYVQSKRQLQLIEYFKSKVSVMFYDCLDT